MQWRESWTFSDRARRVRRRRMCGVRASLALASWLIGCCVLLAVDAVSSQIPGLRASTPPDVIPVEERSARDARSRVATPGHSSESRVVKPVAVVDTLGRHASETERALGGRASHPGRLTHRVAFHEASQPLRRHARRCADVDVGAQRMRDEELRRARLANRLDPVDVVAEIREEILGRRVGDARADTGRVRGGRARRDALRAASHDEGRRAARMRESIETWCPPRLA